MKNNSFRPAANQWRLDATMVIVLGAALGLIAYDSWVSYQGFLRLQLSQNTCLVFALLIAITQLAVGANHVVGSDWSIRGDNGDELIDTAFVWGIRCIYLVDIASNAVEFGIGKALTLDNLRADPANALGVGAIFAGLAFLLSFGDEMLLRLNDRISIGSVLNRVRSRAYHQSAEANMRYLAAERAAQNERARQMGSQDGQQWYFGRDLNGSPATPGRTHKGNL